MGSDDYLASLHHKADVDRLLPDEDPETDDVDDAEHWQHVYSQLLGFKDSILKRVTDLEPDLLSDARVEVAHDLNILRHERERLQRRFSFWKERLSELQRSRS